MKKSKRAYVAPDIRKPTKSLKFLRVVTMIFKVLSMILFVCSIIATVVGLVLSCYVVSNKDVYVRGVRTLEWVIQQKYGVSVYTVSFACLSNAIITAGLIPLGWLGWRLFGNSFRAKTPFTMKSARDWLRLAIITAGVAIVAIGLVGIVFAIYYGLHGRDVEFVISIPWFSYVLAAVVFVILSFVVRYGAQLREQQKKK